MFFFPPTQFGSLVVGPEQARVLLHLGPLVICCLFHGPSLSQGSFPFLNALGPSAHPPTPHPTPRSLSRVSEGPAQATPTPQRNPSSPRLRITKQDNHSIHLFMAHCGAHPGLRKGTLSVGELSLLLSHSLFPLFFFNTFSWGWEGENFDGVKGHPPKICVHYYKPPAPFSSTYQGYEEESELQSWRWT